MLSLFAFVSIRIDCDDMYFSRIARSRPEYDWSPEGRGLLPSSPGSLREKEMGEASRNHENQQSMDRILPELFWSWKSTGSPQLCLMMR